MTIQALGYIQFRTHSVAVSKDSDTLRIYCFKATATRCDIESFIDLDVAADYILAPFPLLVYELVMGGETDSEN